MGFVNKSMAPFRKAMENLKKYKGRQER